MQRTLAFRRDPGHDRPHRVPIHSICEPDVTAFEALFRQAFRQTGAKATGNKQIAAAATSSVALDMWTWDSKKANAMIAQPVHKAMMRFEFRRWNIFPPEELDRAALAVLRQYSSRARRSNLTDRL
jgi:hypothetical protein